MTGPFFLSLDRSSGAPLTRQIRDGIALAIGEGRLKPGARLPSWRDLAAQLGVARGTVRAAYDGLVDAQLIVTSGSAGTHVANFLPAKPAATKITPGERFPGLIDRFSAAPLPFQMGVPAQDEFPFKLWSRLMARAARETALLPASYPDPKGEPELRQEIAAYLSLARGIRAAPAQIFITNGFSGGLGFVLRALALEDKTVWMEEPGYPLSRQALELAGAAIVPVRTDQEGLIVDDGIRQAPGAQAALVTPGQQAPLGMTLSLPRRRALLDWATRAKAWIIEDDYLSELQLKGRATPALAAVDQTGRVIHIGTFSKTISPALRLGFARAPFRRCRVGAVAGAGAADPARRHSLHARGALYAPSAPHEAAIRRPPRCAARGNQGRARRHRGDGRTGFAAAPAGRHRRPPHRPRGLDARHEPQCSIDLVQGAVPRRYGARAQRDQPAG